MTRRRIATRRPRETKESGKSSRLWKETLSLSPIFSSLLFASPTRWSRHSRDLTLSRVLPAVRSRDLSLSQLFICLTRARPVSLLRAHCCISAGANAPYATRRKKGRRRKGRASSAPMESWKIVARLSMRDGSLNYLLAFANRTNVDGQEISLVNCSVPCSSSKRPSLSERRTRKLAERGSRIEEPTVPRKDRRKN